MRLVARSLQVRYGLVQQRLGIPQKATHLLGEARFQPALDRQGLRHRPVD